jgi:hypothetical protein
MDRKDYYYREKVTEAELDGGFDDAEQADHDMMADFGLIGIAYGMGVAEHSPSANLTVDVAGPGCAYDNLGQRIHFATLQNVNCALDYLGFSTAVLGALNERYLGVFVKFARNPADPRIDGHGATIYFEQEEYHSFVVVKGTEAPIGLAVPPSPPSTDHVLLQDVRLIFGQTQILNADLSATRRDTTFKATWKDGTQLLQGQIDDALEEIVSTLAALSGAVKIGAAATAGSPTALVDGSVKSQVDALLAATNLRATLAQLAAQVAPTGASLVGAKLVAGSPESFVVGTVESQLAAILGWVNARFIRDGTQGFGGDLKPDGNNTRDIGLTGTRWKELFAYSAQFSTRVLASKVQPYTVGNTPSSADERDSLVLRNLAKCVASVTAAGALTGEYWNVDSINHVAASGAYQIVVSQLFESSLINPVACVRGADPTRKAISCDRSTQQVFWVYTKDNNVFGDHDFTVTVMQ